MGIGTGQKVLRVNVSLDFVIGDKGIQFPAVGVDIKSAAPIKKCIERVLVRHMRNLCLLPDEGDVEYLPRIDFSSSGHF